MNDHKVRLSHHDPRWKQEFEQMRSCVFDAAQGWVTAVEHVGSTYFPTIIARPSIDLVAGLVEGGNMLETADYLEGLNFQRLPLPKWISDKNALVFFEGWSEAFVVSSDLNGLEGASVVSITENEDVV